MTRGTTTAVPEQTSAVLYNELLGLDPEATARAGEIEWQLRGLIRNAPAALDATVTLIQALLQQGKAPDAIASAETVWRRRDMLSPQVADTFGAQLCDLGLYERSAELSTEDLLGETKFAERARILALNSGNLDRFAALATPWQGAVVEALRKDGLDVLFPETQAVIRKALFGKQVHTGLLVVPGEDTPEISQQFCMAAGYRDRSDLEFGIHEKLVPLYAERRLDLARAWELVTPMLMPLGSLLSHRQ